MGYTSFCLTWKNLLPFIVVAKPRSDLCWKCQQHANAFQRSSNTSETNKSNVHCSLLNTITLFCCHVQQILQEAQDHLALVTKERAMYRGLCSESKMAYQQVQTDSPSPPPTTMHYSFDYAQRVQYPCNPFQPGPIYFLAPRKCSIFGICCEGIPKQRNYLIDEAVDTGKGGNSVCSMLHHFSEPMGCRKTTSTCMQTVVRIKTTSFCRCIWFNVLNVVDINDRSFLVPHVACSCWTTQVHHVFVLASRPHQIRSGLVLQFSKTEVPIHCGEFP